MNVRIKLSLVLICIFANFIFAAEDPNVIVPDIVTLSQSEAEDVITAFGLTVGEVTFSYDDYVSSDHVISQNPVSGTLIPMGSPVDFVVSLGPLPTVPDLSGLTETEAENAIIDARLTIGEVLYQLSTNIPEDYIISQSPDPGTVVYPDSPVNFSVSLGVAEPLAGSGTESDPFLIQDMADFEVFSDPNFHDVDYWAQEVYTKLMCDIDLTGREYYRAVIAWDTTPWFDKDFVGTVYKGIFQGNNHSISNLVINGKARDYIGLFGMISDTARIENLGCVSFDIYGCDDSLYLGSLCGRNNSGTISSCYASGSIYSDVYSVYLGGLCGYNDHGSINNSYATNSVVGYYHLGGLCGYNNHGFINNSYATGPVSGEDSIGGLCGRNNSGTISDSYAAGSVMGGAFSNFLGGLCGDNVSGVISDSYATGTVSGKRLIGGLCGRNISGTIINCYATGLVSGDESLGGLCGYQYGSEAEISNSFWDIQTSTMLIGYNLSSKHPGAIINVSGLTTAQMQDLDTFLDAGWDFVGESDNGTKDIWRMPYITPGYPILSWQRDIPGDYAGSYGVDLVDFAAISGSWLEDYNMPELQDLAQFWLEGDDDDSGPNYPNPVVFLFNETSGSTTYEASGSGYNGTVHGDPNWIAGINGNCLSFNGHDNYVEVAGYSGIKGNSPRSVAVWIKADEDLANSDTTFHSIISWGNTDLDKKWAVFLDSDTGQLTFTNWGPKLIGGPDLEDGQWHHIAVVLPDGANNICQVLIYIDGAIVATNAASLDAVINTSSAENVLIGATDENPAAGIQLPEHFFKGSIDELRIHNSALSASEIADLAGMYD